VHGFWKGLWAEKVPVLGKHDDPLYLIQSSGWKATENARGRDGNLIAERVGELDMGSLNEMVLRSFA
jgi:hypothetical protein